jgi:hypothetical protein
LSEKLYIKQGDQIGRISAYWSSVYLGRFLKIEKVEPFFERKKEND